MNAGLVFLLERSAFLARTALYIALILALILGLVHGLGWVIVWGIS